MSNECVLGIWSYVWTSKITLEKKLCSYDKYFREWKLNSDSHAKMKSTTGFFEVLKDAKIRMKVHFQMKFFTSNGSKKFFSCPMSVFWVFKVTSERQRLHSKKNCVRSTRRSKDMGKRKKMKSKKKSSLDPTVHITYSIYKYELKRIKTHEIRAKYFFLSFFSFHGTFN